MSIDIYSYFIFLCFPHKKREKHNIYISFYSRINRATINFYVLLVYLYKQKKKDAKNAFSARYIELYIKKKNSPAVIAGEGKKGRKLYAVSNSRALSNKELPLMTLFIWFSRYVAVMRAGSA